LNFASSAKVKILSFTHFNSKSVSPPRPTSQTHSFDLKQFRVIWLETKNPAAATQPSTGKFLERCLAVAGFLMTTERYPWKSGWPSYAVKTVFYGHRGHYHISNGELIEQTYLPLSCSTASSSSCALLSSCVNSRILSDKSGRFGGSGGMLPPSGLEPHLGANMILHRESRVPWTRVFSLESGPGHFHFRG